MNVPSQSAKLPWLLLLVGIFLTAAANTPAQEAPAVIFVQIDEAVMDGYFEAPPSPIDYAAFFKKVQEQSPRCLGIVELLHWPSVDPAALNGLVTHTQGLSMIYGAMLDNDVVDANLGAAIGPFPQGITVSGELTGLPAFKSIGIAPSPRVLATQHAGFTRIDFGEDLQIIGDHIQLPLIASGPNAEILPSLAIAIAGQALNISWQNVKFQLGKTFQFEDHGRAIPIDAAGRTQVPLEQWDAMRVLSAESLIGSGPIDPPMNDAILIVGSDLESDRIFALPNGDQVSRAAILTHAVRYLLEATTALPPPPVPAKAVQEETEATPLVVTNPPPVEPALDHKTHSFPDLRAPNIGLWILSISFGLAIGGLLLLAKTSSHQDPTLEKPSPSPMPQVEIEVPDKIDDAEEPTPRGEIVSEDTVEPTPPEVPDEAPTAPDEESTDLEASAPADASDASDPTDPPKPFSGAQHTKRRKKHSARKKPPRSHRRRPS